METQWKNVLMNGMTLQEFRSRATTAPYSEIWQHILDGWKEILAEDSATDEYLSHGNLGWHSITPAVVESAILSAVNDDEEALQHVERCIGYLAKVYEGSEEYLESILSQHRRPAISHGEVAIAADIARDSLSAESRSTLCRIMKEHIIPFSSFERILMRTSAGNNIQVYLSMNAGIAALLWGEECEYEGWENVVSDTREICIKYLAHACDENGFGYEGVGYVQDMLAAVTLFAFLHKQAGRGDIFKDAPRLQQTGHATIMYLLPDRSSLLNAGDVGLASPPSLAWLLILAREYDDPVLRGFWNEFEGPPIFFRTYRQPDTATEIKRLWHLMLAFLLWDADAEAIPVADAGLPLTQYSPGTEISHFRTSWGSDAVHLNYLGAGMAHTCLTHRHADCGHFSIFAYGEYLAIDTGRYNGHPDQHSVTLVDGLPKDAEGWHLCLRHGRLHGFQQHKILDYIIADAAHMKDCMWADRHCFFVRLEGDECYMVFIDNIKKDTEKHSYLWQLQAHPDSSLTTDEVKATVEGKKARLDITFAIPGREAFPDDPHSIELDSDEKWWSWPYGKDADRQVYDPELSTTSIRRPRLLANVKGANGQVAAVVVPRREEQLPLVVNQITHPHLIHLEIEGDRFHDTLLCALDHKHIEAPGYSGRCEFAFVRRENGEIRDTWTSDGSPLNVSAGK
jgi:hypothetical protein